MAQEKFHFNLMEVSFWWNEEIKQNAFMVLLFIIGGLGRVCLSVYILPFSENCKIDQNSNLTPVKVLAAHSCKTKNWWSSTLTFPKIAFLHGGDWLMSVIRNRLHVAMGVISHRWQKTSKCGKNIRDTLCCALHDTSCFCHILTSSVTYFRREKYEDTKIWHDMPHPITLLFSLSKHCQNFVIVGHDVSMRRQKYLQSW